MDILKTTNKAPFTGVILAIGYKYKPEVIEYVKQTPHNVYIAKHCDNVSKPTHIANSGIVNRYGWVFTDETLFSDESNSRASIEICKGWFQKIQIKDVKEIDEILAANS